MNLSLKERATKEAIDQIYITSKFSISSHFITTLIISFLLIDLLPLSIILAGLSAHIIVLLGRTYSVYKYMNIKETIVEADRINNWINIYKVGVFLTGSLWGLTFFVLYSLPIEYHFIIFTLIISMAAAGLVTLGMVLSIYISFIFPMLGITTLWMLLQNDKMHLLIALLTVTGIVYYFFIARRITQNFNQVFIEKELSKELQLQYKEQAQIVEQVNDSVISTDLNGNILTWNSGSEKMLGYSAGEVIGKNMSIIHRAEDIQQNIEYANSLITTGSFKVDAYLVKKSKDLVYATVSLSLLRDEVGNIKGLIGVSHDITQRKKTEDDLAEQYNLLHDIIDSMPLRIFWKDKDLLYLGANKLLLEDAQLDSIDEIIGKSDYELPWEEGQADIYRDNDLAVINSGIAKLNFEETYTTQDGETVVLLKSKVPLKDVNGDIMGVLCTYEDITYKRNMENKLIEQSRLVQMGEMISMIAHQWRQPLSIIAMQASNMSISIELEENFTHAEIISCSKSVSEQCQYLSQTIDDFRNFYKPNKKAVTVKLETIILKVLDILRASLINDDIEIIEEYKSNEMIEVYSNEIMQVVLNILKNSQDNFKEKEIENPSIKISVMNSSLSICDNGGGISENIIDKIFDPYFSTKSELNGTGLGLYMSKIIVAEHHQGILSVKNIEDGVCFKIELEVLDK